MTDTSWQPDLTLFPGPKYLALARALRDAVRSGKLLPGAQLPTVRDLAWSIHVTPGTVSRACSQPRKSCTRLAMTRRVVFCGLTRNMIGRVGSLERSIPMVLIHPR